MRSAGRKLNGEKRLLAALLLLLLLLGEGVVT